MSISLTGTAEMKRGSIERRQIERPPTSDRIQIRLSFEHEAEIEGRLGREI